MTDLTDREEDQTIAAEYALGLLTPPEARAFEARLPVDPQLRADYALWAEDFVALTDAIAPVVPPKSVLTGIEAQLFPQQKRSLLERLGLLPAMLGGLTAALVVLFVTNQGWLDQPGVGPAYTASAQIAAEDQSLVVLARFDPAAGALRIERSAGGALPGRALELWLIAGDNPPVSLGLLPQTATGDIAVPEALLASLDGGVLAISDEPPGGSPTGAPTGAVLAVGAVTTI